MGADDPTIPARTRLARDFDPEDVPAIAWGGFMTGLGFLLATVHASHIGDPRPLWAVVIGGVVPLVISIGGIMPFGLLLVLPGEDSRAKWVDFIHRIGPWVAGWMLVGMVWMGIAGAGSVLYQTEHSLFQAQSVFLIAIFASYGAIPGAITGYYYGRTAYAATEIAKRERYLAVFSRVLRHNFRNQMNLLQGELDLAGQTAQEPTAAHITQASEYGAGLMDTVEKQRFLVETVTEPKSPRRQRVSTVVEMAVESVRETYPNGAVTVTGMNGDFVSAHPEIDRAISELLENAIRYSADPSPTVEIGATRENGSVVVTVSDSGPAIPTTEQAILTQDLEPNQLHHGSGLGLWIVDRLTEQSNGRVEIQQKPSGGNTVSLELPAEYA